MIVFFAPGFFAGDFLAPFFGAILAGELSDALRLADLPSRGEFGVLRWKYAQEVQPVLALEYEGDAWAILQERWSLS